MKVIEGLYYTKDHEWLKAEGNIGYVGITDFAQHALGDIAFVELPDAGSDFGAEEVFGVVESVKTASDLYIPIACTVIEKNSAVEDTPECINEDPYENWLVKIEIKDVDALKALLDAGTYAELTKE